MTEAEKKIELSILFREYVRDIPDYRQRSAEERKGIIAEFLSLVDIVYAINRRTVPEAW